VKITLDNSERVQQRFEDFKNAFSNIMTQLAENLRGQIPPSGDLENPDSFIPKI
jgi:hypothetical protein